MSQTSLVKEALGTVQENQLIWASGFYKEKLADQIGKTAFYKCLARLCKQGYLTKLNRGLYCRHKSTKYGKVLPSEQEIIEEFISQSNGMVVGYRLYNRLNLTTQISKKVEVFSSKIEGRIKRINNIVIINHKLDYSASVVENISMMEILSNFHRIENLNQVEFKAFCERYSRNYNEAALIQVLERMSYSKKTIAFLKEILSYYNTDNGLDKYISKSSNYKIPNIKEIL